MPIIEGKQTNEQINQSNEAGNETRQRLVDKIKSDKVFQSLDIPTETNHARTKEIAQEVNEDPEDEITGDNVDGQDENQEEVEEGSEEESEETEDSDETEFEDEDAEEDMVAKSKHQRRIDRVIAENKRLKSELQKSNVKIEEETNKNVDPTTQKLLKMNSDELKALKREVRTAQLEEKDKTKLNELLDLEDKIDETMRNAPARFQTAQRTSYDKMADKISHDPDITDIEKAAPKIFNRAVEIYQQYPKLQMDIDGQAMALEMAANEYKKMSQYSLKKSSVSKLKSQVNVLKRKTALDSKSTKSTGDTQLVDKLRRQASNGTNRDKLALVREDKRFKVDEMIPAEYK